jgi:hypothetical protein
MQQQRPFTAYRARRKGDGKTRLSVLDIARKNVRSDGIRPFIPPPTREQLMAGSANLRRVQGGVATRRCPIFAAVSFACSIAAQSAAKPFSLWAGPHHTTYP